MNLALLQSLPQPDVGAAVACLQLSAAQAASMGADLLLTPEMFVGGYNIGPEKIVANAAQSDEVIEALRSIALTYKLALAVGLGVPGGARPYNTCLVIGADGTERARYQKTHLYGAVDAAQFSAGMGLSTVFDLHGWKVSLAICYDIEFPEVARSLALKGANLILVPTANMTPFETVATRLVPARAEENALFIAYCNYAGAEGAFAYNGLSCVVGPDGNDRQRATDGAQLLFATLDLQDVTKTRRIQTHLEDRRTELYRD